jgi:hypothetical protein
MTIEIHGFTTIQAAFADILWEIKTEEELDVFLEAVPKNLRADCQVAFDMIVAEVLAQDSTIDPATLDIINQFKNSI